MDKTLKNTRENFPEKSLTNLGRRRFLKASAALGGGLIIGFSLPQTLTGMLRFAAAETTDKPPIYPPNAFIRIAPDNTVTTLVNKSKMGQGVYTALPMLVAEELECNWRKLRVESAPVAPVYHHTAWCRAC